MAANRCDLDVLIVGGPEDAAACALGEILRQDTRVRRVRAVDTPSSALHLLRSADGSSSDERAPGDRPGVDVVFLGLWSGLTGGSELAWILAALPCPPVLVFVTDREDLAVEAFQVGALDFLLVPVGPERVAVTVARAAALRRLGHDGARARPADAGDGAVDEVIPVDSAGATILVPRDRVRYVEASGDYSRLHLDRRTSYLVRVPLKTLELRWAAADFCRVHRSYLVCLTHATELRTAAGRCHLRVGSGAGSVLVPVSRRYAGPVRKKLQQVS